MKDEINKPSHYTQGNIECIDYIEDCGFGEGYCRGNVIKYITRAKYKGTELKDLRKARFYLDREIVRLEKIKVLENKNIFWKLKTFFRK